MLTAMVLQVADDTAWTGDPTAAVPCTAWRPLPNPGAEMTPVTGGGHWRSSSSRTPPAMRRCSATGWRRPASSLPPSSATSVGPDGPARAAVRLRGRGPAPARRAGARGGHRASCTLRPTVPLVALTRFDSDELGREAVRRAPRTTWEAGRQRQPAAPGVDVRRGASRSEQAGQHRADHRHPSDAAGGARRPGRPCAHPTGGGPAVAAGDDRQPGAARPRRAGVHGRPERPSGRPGHERADRRGRGGADRGARAAGSGAHRRARPRCASVRCRRWWPIPRGCRR